MNEYDTVRLAQIRERVAEISNYDFALDITFLCHVIDQLEHRFEPSAAAAMRERAAKVCEEASKKHGYGSSTRDRLTYDTYLTAAERIRALPLDGGEPERREAGWWTIETAPKDNPAPRAWPAKWLLLTNGHHVGVGRYYHDDFEDCWVDEHLEPIEPAPTHWMPLSSPPESADG